MPALVSSESTPRLLHSHRSGLQMYDRLAVISGWTPPSSKVCPLLKNIPYRQVFESDIPELTLNYIYLFLPAVTKILSALQIRTNIHPKTLYVGQIRKLAVQHLLYLTRQQDRTRILFRYQFLLRTQWTRAEDVEEFSSQSYELECQ